MATGNFTTTTHSAFIPEIWSEKAKVATESNLVMGNLVLRDYEGEIKEMGDTVHIPNISNLTAKQKAADTDVTFETITETSDTISIDQHWYTAFKVEDIVKAQANMDLKAPYTDKAGYALAKKIDTHLLGLYANLSQQVGSAGTDVNETNFLLAIQYLDVNDAPETDRHAVFYADQKSAMLDVDQFVRYDATGQGPADSPIIKGRFGEIYGVNTYFTTNVTTTGSPTGAHNLVFHREFAALAIQKDIRAQSDYNIRSLADEVVLDVLYGYSEYRDNFGVVYLT